MDQMNRLWRCRTPSDLVAVQSELVGNAMQSTFESNRRIADLSLKLSEDAAKYVTQNMERVNKHAA